MKLLSAAPVVAVTGVVDAGGAGGIRSQGQPTWTQSLTFDAWRVKSGPLMRTPLYVRRETSEQAMDRARDTIQPYSILSIQARLAIDPEKGRPVAQLERIVGTSKDAELREEARRLREPVYYKDKVLGKLTLDRLLDRFSARKNWNGSSIELSVQNAAPNDFERALGHMRLLFRQEKKWDRLARAYAASKLLRLYNEGWREERPVITAQVFGARLKPESLSVTPDGEFSIWYDDGGLFWDHAIAVTGNVSGRFKDADMAG